MRQTDLFGIPKIKDEVVNSIPYMGSKRKLATKLLNSIYQTIGDFENLYDLFGGGGAMSMASMKAGHKTFYNEFNSGVANLMKYLQKGGKIPLEWVSREEFKKHKNGDDWYSGYIKTCWSFGNNQKAYLFGKEIEDLKRQAHEYLLANGYLENPSKRIALIKEFKEKMNISGRFELQQLQQLQQLEQLERLQQLHQLEQLEITNLSYEQVQIQTNSIIYCDPPYQDTAKYQETIDYNEFYKWALDNPNPVFVSSYKMPKEFKEVASFEHRSILSGTANNLVIEKLFWNGKNINYD